MKNGAGPKTIGAGATTVTVGAGSTHTGAGAATTIGAGGKKNPKKCGRADATAGTKPSDKSDNKIFRINNSSSVPMNLSTD
jgi:hypothetical protein